MAKNEREESRCSSENPNQILKQRQPHAKTHSIIEQRVGTVVINSYENLNIANIQKQPPVFGITSRPEMDRDLMELDEG